MQINLITDGLNLDNEHKKYTVILSGFIGSKGYLDSALNKILYENKIFFFC